jgi:hypothetical protein
MIPTSRIEVAICVYFGVRLTAAVTRRSGLMSAMASRSPAA